MNGSPNTSVRAGVQRLDARTKLPAIEGLQDLTMRDCASLATWTITSRITIARRRTASARVRATLGALAATLSWPLIAGAHLVLRTRPRRRYYVHNRAVLAVVASDQRWLICDHLAAAPGDGDAHALRRAALPALIAAADASAVALDVTVRDARLAEVWRGAIPGLERMASNRLIGQHLRRQPKRTHTNP